MNNSTENRWLEIQFYFICIDLNQINNNLMDLMDLVDNLALLGGYSSEIMKTLVQELLCTTIYKPNKEETCLLGYKYGVPIKQLKEKTGVHNRTLYNWLKEDAVNPRKYYPRFASEQLNEIEKFINTFNKIKKVGFTNE